VYVQLTNKLHFLYAQLTNKLHFLKSHPFTVFGLSKQPLKFYYIPIIVGYFVLNSTSNAQ